MTDRLLDRYAGKAPLSSRLLAERDGEETESMGCFGWLRGLRDRAIMLELRKKDGHVLAVGYAWIERVEYRPEQGITLHLPGREILIKGSGLNSDVRAGVRLLDGIVRHRVTWVAEAEQHAEYGNGDKMATLIESIQWAD